MLYAARSGGTGSSAAEAGHGSGAVGRWRCSATAVTGCHKISLGGGEAKTR